MIKSLHIENFLGFQQADLSFGRLTLLLGQPVARRGHLALLLRFLGTTYRGFTLREAAAALPGWPDHFPMDAPDNRLHIEAEHSIPGHGALRHALWTNLGDAEDHLRVEREWLIKGDTAILDNSDGVIEQNQEGRLRYRLAHFDRPGQHGPVHDTDGLRSAIPTLMQPGGQPAGVTEVCRSFVEAAAPPAFLDTWAGSIRDLLGATAQASAIERLATQLDDHRRAKECTAWLEQTTGQPVRSIEVDPGDVLTPPGLALFTDDQPCGDATCDTAVLRSLAIWALLREAPKGSTVYIEGLEHHLHPARHEPLLRQVWKLVRERGIQVIATTDSPAMLDWLYAKHRRDAKALLLYAAPKRGTRAVLLDELEAFYEESQSQRPGDLFRDGWLERAALAADPHPTGA